MSASLLTALAVVAVAGYVQAAVGIGFAMIAVPLLVLIDPVYAPGPALSVMLVLSAVMTVRGLRHVDRQGLTTLLPGLLAGTALGALVAGALGGAGFQLAFGVVVVLAVGIVWSGAKLPASPLTSGFGGAVAGFMGTLSGMHGPPLAVIYHAADNRTARATIALIFVVASALSLAALNYAGRFGAAEMRMGIELMPGLAIGYVAAVFARGWLSDSRARKIMLIVAGASGAILIVRSLAALL